MLDEEEVNKLVNRTRKEWEDQTVDQQARAIEGMVKVGSMLLGSPPLKKLMSSREAQESLRQFVVSLKVRYVLEELLQLQYIKKGRPPGQLILLCFCFFLQLLLEDPERECVFGDSDRWHEMFDNLKKWEGASPDRLLERLLEFLEHHGPDKD